MNRKILTLLICISLLAQITACGSGSREKRNVRICSQRLTKLVEGLEKGKQLPGQPLTKKVLEICNIYGFESIDQFTAAKEKYPDEIGNAEETQKLEHILKLVKGKVTSPLDPKSDQASNFGPQGEESAEQDERDEESVALDFADDQARAVSLKQLLEEVKQHGNRQLPRNLVQFCGLTKIMGYVLDKTNRDIIIIGIVEKNVPPLYLEDFVIALRNAYNKYVQRDGNTLIYSNPSCTIDPNPNVLAKMNQIWNGQTNKNRKAKIRQWRTVCRSPQKVGVFGVPFDSHFAWVMVKADYDMKNLTSGEDTLDIKGFSSLTGLKVVRATQCLEAGEAISFPLAGLNRFWFHPGINRYRENDDSILIDKCPVLLLTEEEHLTKGGQIVGSGKADPFAKQFTERFSKYYPEISELRPIYRELENLFRFVALAKIIKSRAPHEKVDLDLDHLLEKFPIAGVRVKRTLPGRYYRKNFEHQETVLKGIRTYQYSFFSCGGVTIKIDVGKNDFIHEPKVKKIKDIIISQKPPGNTLAWNVKRLGWWKKRKRKRIGEDEINQLNHINRNNAASFTTLLVDFSTLKLKLYHDSIQPAYKGYNTSALLDKAVEKLSGQQALCFELKNYSNKRARTFIENLITQKQKKRMLTPIVIVTGKHNALELHGILYSTQAQITPKSTIKSAITKATQGKHKGWYQTVTVFFVKQKQKIMKMTIYSKSKKVLESFLNKMKQKRIQRNNIPMMKDIVDTIKDIQRIEGKGTPMIDIIFEFLEQVLGIEISRSTPIPQLSPFNPIPVDKPVEIAA